MAEPQAVAQPTQPRGNVSRYIDDPTEIRRALAALCSQDARVSLRFDGESGEFTAHVVEVREDAVLLDDVKPRTGLGNLRRGETFALTARSEGTYVYAEALAATEIGEERGLPYFVAPLPARMLLQQRRRAARFRLPLSLSARGTLVRLHRGGRLVDGSILDISIGGCRVSFDGPIQPRLRVGESIDRCDVEVAQHLAVIAHVSIRHCTIDPSTGGIVAGIEFDRMEANDRARLEAFIQRISRNANPT